MEIRRGLAHLFVFVFVFMGVSIPACADSEFDTVASNFLRHIGSDRSVASTQLIEKNSLAPSQPAVPIAYLVNLEGEGYILISTSHKLTPVKAYSLSGSFEGLPEPFRNYLMLEMEYNRRVVDDSSTGIQAKSLSETEISWAYLLDTTQTRSTKSYTPDTFLLTTTWNQSYPYNRYLPEDVDTGEKVVAGCVNIAMSQVMKYHSHPAKSIGVYYHDWNGQPLKTIAYRPVNWGNMPNSLVGDVPEYQIDEAALLIRDLGIMNRTAFSATDSGASSNIQDFIRGYGYSTDISTMDNTDVTAFFDTLRGEIDAMRPVLLSFPGHMTVADGYADDQIGKTIHVNMGWGGHDDGFYYLDDVVIAGGYPFSPDLDIIYSIKPCSGTDCSNDLEAEDGIDGMEISGKFNHRYDIDEYQLYLKGTTTIGGTRGYGNQAFYITLFSASNERLVSLDDTIITSLAAGRYRIRVSIMSEASSGYTYDLDDVYNDYEVTVSTDSLTQVEIDSVNDALDFAPIINSEFPSVLLDSGQQEATIILVDTRDENDDQIAIEIDNTNPLAVDVLLSGNLLSITPKANSGGLSSKITVTSTANGKTAEKSFVVMVSDGQVASGKEIVIMGVFEDLGDDYDFDSHKVILEGSCTISGDNNCISPCSGGGTDCPCFFTSVEDLEGNVIEAPVADDISGAFEKDIYSIGASLSRSTSYFPYSPDIAQYTLAINCPDADDTPENLAALLGIDLSGTDPSSPLVIDVNNDGGMDLQDVILLLQVLSGVDQQSFVLDADLNNDGTVGLGEAIYVLQVLGGVR